MNQKAKPVAGNALLLECDSRGLILSMSDAARMAFGSAPHLIDILRSAAPSGRDGLLRHTSGGRFMPVFQEGKRLWITAELGSPHGPVPCTSDETARTPETETLLDVQNEFLDHYFRLQNAERRLSTRIRLLRPATPGQALFQVERERERLAAELHTGVGQLLAAIRLHLEVISAHLPDPPTRVRLALDHIDELAIGALQQVRSVSQRLHPPEWQRLTLSAALQQLWLVSGITQKFMGSLRLDPLPDEPSLDIKILIYRGAQEALSNLFRHSQACRVEMALERRPDQLVLTVTDDGVGFDVAAFESAPPSVSSGLGLRSIRDLATSLGGGIMIESGSSGTKLQVTVPVNLPDA